MENPDRRGQSRNQAAQSPGLTIVGIEPVPAHRTAEVSSTSTTIDRVERRCDLNPDRMVGDTAYDAAPMLGWIVEEKCIAAVTPRS